MKLIENTPIGTRRSMCHVNYGPGKRHEWKEMEFPEFSPEDVERGRRIREARRATKMTLGDLADRLGIRPSVISRLEFGSARFADGTEEAKFFDALKVRR